MASVNATELAAKLDVSRARISQYVTEGKLEGCYQGDGRNRRFDLGKVAEALGRRLDQGQRLGNGADTQRALSSLDDEASVKRLTGGSGAQGLPAEDDDRYKLARTLKAEEEARRLRRQNAQDDGLYVLADAVALQVRRQIGQEVAEFESVMRDAARRAADELGVDFKTVRAILTECWRAHRAKRSEALQAVAASAKMTANETEQDI